MIKNIIKTNKGLLTQNNPLLESKLSDFICKGSMYREDKTFVVLDGYIETNFPQTDFVILVNKDNSPFQKNDSEYGIYTRINGRRNGIRENATENKFKTATHWKIISYDGYIQTYCSFDDMINWEGLGGGQYVEITTQQGFFSTNREPLKIYDYKVYSSPYVKFLNLPKGSMVKIFDKNDNILYEKKTIGITCEIFLKSPLKDCYFIVYNYADEFILYQSEMLDIDFGDEFNSIPYELKVFCNLKEINTIDTTYLIKEKHNIRIENISNDNYENLKVKIIKDIKNIDDILLSDDDINYTDTIIIPSLEANQYKDLFLLIKKDIRTSNFGQKFFDIEIS